MRLTEFVTKPIVEAALREEIGPGDTTGGFLVPDDLEADAIVYAKGEGVVCGLPLAAQTIKAIDPDTVVSMERRDGDVVEPGTVLLSVQGKAWVLFAAERCMLDWIQYLSGISTRTAEYVARVEQYGTRITDTRKGVPGVRVLQKYAVRVGGAHNHLFGLHNCILVKDNHIKAAGGITAAVELLRARAQHTFKIELECETLDEVEEAVSAGADIIMFDNMSLEDMKKGLDIVDGRAMTEASGGITLDSIESIAQTGVDVISVGEITHSVTVMDVSMDVGEMKASAQREVQGTAKP